MHSAVRGTFIASFLLLFPSSAAIAASADVFGDWVYPDNGSVIRVYGCSSSLCAKIIKVKDPSRRDVNNPNPKLRNRPIVGVVIATGGAPTGGNGWIGNLYNPLDGNTYRGTLHVLNRNTLTVVGCFGGGLLCNAKTLKRSARRTRRSAVANAEMAGRTKVREKPKQGGKAGNGVKPASNVAPLKKPKASLQGVSAPSSAPTLTGSLFSSTR